MFTILINAPGRDPRQVKCMHRECGIGRGDANLVMLQGWNIASRHATLMREEQGVFILPLGGKEPIVLNGQPVLAKRGPISGSDEVKIGSYTLRIAGDETVRCRCRARPTTRSWRPRRQRRTNRPRRPPTSWCKAPARPT